MLGPLNQVTAHTSFGACSDRNHICICYIVYFNCLLPSGQCRLASGGIAVGLILGFLAVILIIKNHQYIIGKPLSEEIIEELIEALETDPCIEHVVEFKSVAVDVGKYKIFATVEWNGSPLYEEIYEAGDLKEEFDNIKDDFKEFAKLMLKTTDRIPRLMGTHIDMIEKNIVEKFPQVAYVDIEIN